MKMLGRIWIYVALAVFCVAAEVPRFKVTKKYAVPGDGGFDYIVFDSSSNRLYVSHGVEVNVLNADSGEILGTVKDTPGVHGIAIVPTLHRGFTTNGANATVSVFDTNTLRTERTIPVPKDPDFVLYDSRTNRVLVCHGDAPVITAIDPEKETVIGHVSLGGGAEAAVVDGKGAGFVNLEEAAEVVSFNPKTLTVNEKWPINGCKAPKGLAIDVPNSRLFIGCRNRILAVMDSKSGRVLATLPIGERVDTVAFDPESKLIFAANGGGTISVIRQRDLNEYEFVGDIQTQKSAKTMALDPKFKRLFLSTAEMQAPLGDKTQTQRPKPKRGTFAVLVVEPQ